MYKGGHGSNSEEKWCFKGYRHFKKERKTQENCIETAMKDLKALKLIDEIPLDRIEWKHRFHVANTPVNQDLRLDGGTNF